MRDYQSLTHTTWDCKYHVVFIPKRRKKVIFGMIRKHLGKVFHELAAQKKCQIVEGHLMPDHVHMCISIPPKYSVSYVVDILKGKVPYRLRADLWGNRGISRVKIFGHVVILYPR
ncbi:putative transposase [Nitrosomonas sp. Nm34]|nr:putative transposase [Nitrosomonas sp. Nm34]